MADIAGHLDVVKLLLDLGDRALWMPRPSNVEVVKALMDVGDCELRMKGNDGKNCLSVSAFLIFFKVGKALVDLGGCEVLVLHDNIGMSCLCIADHFSSSGIVRVLRKRTSSQSVGARSRCIQERSDFTLE